MQQKVELPCAGTPNLKSVLRKVHQADSPSNTPVRKTVAFTSVHETHYRETETSTDAEEATPSPGDDAEELQHVEVCALRRHPAVSLSLCTRSLLPELPV